MLSPQEATDRAAALVDAAIKAGADAADAAYSADASLEVQMRLGLLEDVARSEGEDMALRVFVGQRSASVSSSAMDPALLAALVDRAIAMAREAPEDKYAGLAPSELLMKGAPPFLDSFDPAEPSPEELKGRALEAEDAARAVEGVTNSEGAGASLGRSVVAIATSGGFAGGYQATHHGVSASVLAGTDGDMQRDYDWSSTRHLSDLNAAEKVGRSAGERAVKRLNPVVPRSGTMPVILDPRVAGSLLSHFIGAIAGSAIARRTSFLLDRLGDRIFAHGITIVDDPHRLRGLASRGFDGEGLPTRRVELVSDGVLNTWLIDSASGRQLDLPPTGHASRGGGVGSSNLHLEPGVLTPAQLIAEVGEGIYITELIGHGVNGVTGDYSRGAGGFMIRNGELAEPVSEFTVAGNLKDMFLALTPANDLTFLRGVNAPTLRIDGMTIAGA